MGKKKNDPESQSASNEHSHSGHPQLGSSGGKFEQNSPKNAPPSAEPSVNSADSTGKQVSDSGASDGYLRAQWLWIKPYVPAILLISSILFWEARHESKIDKLEDHDKQVDNRISTAVEQKSKDLQTEFARLREEHDTWQLLDECLHGMELNSADNPQLILDAYQRLMAKRAFKTIPDVMQMGLFRHVGRAMSRTGFYDYMPPQDVETVAVMVKGKLRNRSIQEVECMCNYFDFVEHLVHSYLFYREFDKAADLVLEGLHTELKVLALSEGQSANRSLAVVANERAVDNSTYRITLYHALRVTAEIANDRFRTAEERISAAKSLIRQFTPRQKFDPMLVSGHMATIRAEPIWKIVNERSNGFASAYETISRDLSGQTGPPPAVPPRK